MEVTLLSLSDFRFGIEHEFPAVNGDGCFCDFFNSTFDEFDRVISELPVIESDYASLRVGDLGIKNKRWYIEGFERFSDRGGYLRTDPKGFEIRTPICGS
ncbi:MAG: glutamate--cysteine ligase, partial [Coriobacteriia bacterium]|nr:glutamate--cysteine ligase [Coriobacteriia bacterium]